MSRPIWMDVEETDPGRGGRAISTISCHSCKHLHLAGNECTLHGIDRSWWNVCLSYARHADNLKPTVRMQSEIAILDMVRSDIEDEA